MSCVHYQQEKRLHKKMLVTKCCEKLLSYDHIQLFISFIIDKLTFSEILCYKNTWTAEPNKKLWFHWLHNVSVGGAKIHHTFVPNLNKASTGDQTDNFTR